MLGITVGFVAMISLLMFASVFMIPEYAVRVSVHPDGNDTYTVLVSDKWGTPLASVSNFTKVDSINLQLTELIELMEFQEENEPWRVTTPQIIDAVHIGCLVTYFGLFGVWFKKIIMDNPGEKR